MLFDTFVVSYQIFSVLPYAILTKNSEVLTMLNFLKESQNPFLLRKVLISASLLCFFYLSIIFITQYRKYRQVEEQLNAAYRAGHSKSSTLYRLFSTYGEADNLFRLYTVDFDESIYRAYTAKLDTIKHDVDSLANLPIDNTPLILGTAAIETRKSLAIEFVDLQKSLDALIFFARDSLPEIASLETPALFPQIDLNMDSALSRIAIDTLTLNGKSDTLIQEKGNLFNRIFRAKNDTLVLQGRYEQLLTNQTNTILRNVRRVLLQNYNSQHKNLTRLQQNYAVLRHKERELIQANYSLLRNLKNGFDKIIKVEHGSLEQAELKSMALHEHNAQLFGRHLSTALILMFLLIVFILFYQYNAGKYEKTLQLEREHSRNLAQEKTSILANVSHEVRTPLNSLMGVVDILLKDGRDQHMSPAYLEAIAHEITMINNTITDILSLSKLEGGELPLDNDYFSPRRLLEDLLLLHIHQAQKKGLQLQHQLDIPWDLEIYSSKFRIKQIVSNLIGNAIKFTAEGSIIVSCTFISGRRQEQLIIRVKDTGIGIPMEHQQNIFRQYYTATESNSSSGFGLGLYISKLLAAQMNAEITLSSSPSKGSTFTLHVPVSRSRLTKIDAAKPSLNDLPNSLRIVLIDDNHINLMYLQHVFKGFPNLSSFDDASHALAYLDTADVDIIITDLHMPSTSGWDILHFVRSHQKLKNVIVFALTADTIALESTQNPSKNNDFQAILTKPLVEEEVASKILQSFRRSDVL